MKVFVGMQATLMQPPPIIMGSRSMRATLYFCFPKYIARVLPPFPPPMTMASYFSESLIYSPPSILQDRSTPSFLLFGCCRSCTKPAYKSRSLLTCNGCRQQIYQALVIEGDRRASR